MELVRTKMESVTTMELVRTKMELRIMELIQIMRVIMELIIIRRKMMDGGRWQH